MLYDDDMTTKGKFVDDELEGKVRIEFDSGEYSIAMMKKGEMHGKYEKFDSDGKKIIQSLYKNGVRSGKGFEYLFCNCRLEGTWKDGQFQGTKFYYPDGSYISGTFIDGDYMEGDYYTKRGRKIKTCILDEPTEKSLAAHPWFIDPYESKTVYVKKSQIKGGQEGLFAKRKIPKGDLCSIYSGIFITQSKVNRRKWDLNDNTIEVNEEFSIDVPKPFHSMKKYTASLGHKANHSFIPNAKYELFYHPKFGMVKSVQAI